VNWLYEEAQVLEREAMETGAVRTRVRIAGEKKQRLLAQVRRAGAELKVLMPVKT
jgi:GTP-binding protein HflX